MSRAILMVGLYRSWLKGDSFVQYLERNEKIVDQFSFFEEEKVLFLSKRKIVSREIGCLIKLITNFCCLKNRTVFCVGGHYAILLLSRCFSFFLGRDYRLYIYNFYLHAAGNNAIVRFILRFLLNNKKCVLIVQSPFEINYYKILLPQLKTYFVPYCADVKMIENTNRIKRPEVDYIFTGGYTNRDYDLVFNCACRMPSQCFVVVTSSLNKVIQKKVLPKNVILFMDIPQSDFEYLLVGSEIVIVPLMANVGSSGQMLCISAMQNKKPIVYCDVSAISYYFTKDSGIGYTLRDEVSLFEAISSLLKNEEKRTAMGLNAYQNYIHNFTAAHRNELLYEILNG